MRKKNIKNQTQKAKNQIFRIFIQVQYKRCRPLVNVSIASRSKYICPECSQYVHTCVCMHECVFPTYLDCCADKLCRCSTLNLCIETVMIETLTSTAFGHSICIYSRLLFILSLLTFFLTTCTL